MREEIKQRIEQIRRGEVPEGYKKTKVGVVPNEWEETRFKKMFSRLSRKNKENNDNVLTISAQYGLISQRDFFNKDIASEDKSNYFLLHHGEFAYNKSYSNGYPFGALKRLDMYDKGIVSPLYICFFANESNKCPNFYVHYFEAGMMNREIQAFAQEGARNHGLLNISVDDFFNSYLLMPPLDEQKKIAEILSAQDKLIALKEKLIEEKKRQKKALMQQLLTGKKRLPGFEYSWEMHTLKTMSTPILRKAGIGQYEILSISAGIGFVNQAQKFGKEIAGEQYKNYTVLQKHEFSYNKGNSKRYPQGCIYPLENRDRAAVPNVFISFNLDETRCFYGFYKYLFESGYLNKQLYRLINSGVLKDVLLNLYDSDFYNCVIPVPSYDEQKKIANIFFSLDKEIIRLEKMLQAEKQKKKALMQLLLTGIVRVK